MQGGQDNQPDTTTTTTANFEGVSTVAGVGNGAVPVWLKRSPAETRVQLVHIKPGARTINPTRRIARSSGNFSMVILSPSEFRARSWIVVPVEQLVHPIAGRAGASPYTIPSSNFDNGLQASGSAKMGFPIFCLGDAGTARRQG